MGARMSAIRLAHSRVQRFDWRPIKPVRLLRRVAAIKSAEGKRLVFRTLKETPVATATEPMGWKELGHHTCILWRLRIGQINDLARGNFDIFYHA